jgi:2-succinyl-5-enolpyruvyl-6-hydroxy-3-cyclohexene-1-carboxylate synthase
MGKLISDKKSVQILVDQCLAQGVKNIIISPGSRNAPLILSFTAIDYFKCYSIVDERSAGFIALGMAQQSGEPVALVCTSGTAALNYAPAIAEAYYQGIPLIVITADRPGEWIDQADGQTIRQHGIYGNYIKYSCTLPVDIYTSDDEWHTKKMIAEAFVKCCKSTPGPVHINVPLREPLYGRMEQQVNTSTVVSHYQSKTGLSEQYLDQLSDCFNNSQRIMILVGMRHPDPQLQKVLIDLGKDERIIVLTESLSNCPGDGFIPCIDRVISSIKADEASLFKPDLLITFDGPIVSKMVKTFLRQNLPNEHWHVSESGEFVDTYQQLSRIIESNPSVVLNQLMPLLKSKPSQFSQTWKTRYEKVSSIHTDYLQSIPWSDLKVFETIFNHLPQPSVLQLGNSTPVRYAQLFDRFNNIESYSNRGTSGIDGSMSTAVGAALARNDEPVVLMLYGTSTCLQTLK